MLAIFERFGDIRGQQRELGIAINCLLHLHRGLERFTVDAGLEVGAQTRFRYLPFCVARRFKQECLAQIPGSQTRLRRSHALVGSGNRASAISFHCFHPAG